MFWLCYLFLIGFLKNSYVHQWLPYQALRCCCSCFIQFLGAFTLGYPVCRQDYRGFHLVGYWVILYLCLQHLGCWYFNHSHMGITPLMVYQYLIALKTCRQSSFRLLVFEKHHPFLFSCCVMVYDLHWALIYHQHSFYSYRELDYLNKLCCDHIEYLLHYFH